MIPASFDYQRPASVDEALALLSEHGYDAKVLAGGQSLIPAMRFRLEEDDGFLHIGTMVRHATIEDSEMIREKYARDLAL
ncbi:MAG: FAD binding domain-containing protein, partial [Gemmatimonadetes bacterium]|nr:FAD binding domain-containing protein [Gemmatimonadota bacterium]